MLLSLHASRSIASFHPNEAVVPKHHFSLVLGKRTLQEGTATPIPAYHICAADESLAGTLDILQLLRTQVDPVTGPSHS